MKKTLKGYVMGFLSASLLVTGIGYAANTTTLYDVLVEGVKIVVDGQKINPTDANGNSVEPIIYNGTTYLPVRAVANAIGKAVYWDGPNYTVYLGNMDGKLEYPTVSLDGLDNIGDNFFRYAATDELTDNYGNSYSVVLRQSSYSSKARIWQSLLNMKYSRFKCMLYVPKGCSSNNTAKILIKADGKTIYSSPEITKTSRPIPVDIDIRGCNDFQIEVTNAEHLGYIADAGFYQ